jgi:hypothetical protein
MSVTDDQTACAFCVCRQPTPTRLQVCFASPQPDWQPVLAVATIDSRGKALHSTSSGLSHDFPNDAE